MFRSEGCLIVTSCGFVDQQCSVNGIKPLTLNQRVLGSSPSAPTIAKALFFNELREELPRTKWVLCDVFGGRTWHGQIAVRLFLCFCISPHSTSAQTRRYRSITCPMHRQSGVGYRKQPRFRRSEPQLLSARDPRSSNRCEADLRPVDGLQLNARDGPSATLGS
jgi:hypothetical protein